MASQRKELQEDAKLRVMQIIIQNPELTTREIAQKVKISNRSAYYLLTAKSIRENHCLLIDLSNAKKKSINY